MIELKLQDYVKMHSQAAAARLLEITPQAVHHMMRREVYLYFDAEDNFICGKEWVDAPARKHAKKLEPDAVPTDLTTDATLPI